MPDYSQMVNMLLQGGGLLGNPLMQQVAQRVPQSKQGLFPNDLSEGAARPYGGGGNSMARYGGEGPYGASQYVGRPDLVQSRIRQIEYDRRLSGHKVDGKYPPHGELHFLRGLLKEMGGQ